MKDTEEDTEEDMVKDTEEDTEEDTVKDTASTWPHGGGRNTRQLSCSQVKHSHFLASALPNLRLIYEEGKIMYKKI